MPHFLPWGQAVFPSIWPNLAKDMQAKPLCWSELTDANHDNSYERTDIISE